MQKYLSIYLIIFFISTLFSCQKTFPRFEITATTEEFILPDGLEISLIAQAPIISAPVAMAEDASGRIWVVEMNGYMRDIDGNEEDLPDGRIVILEDTDQDGQMDKQKIFLDGLVNPRAISFVYDGVLFTDSTALVFAKIEKDQPIDITLVDNRYVVGGNIEHQPNGLFYNLDNWIYSAKSNARYQRKNNKWIKEVTSFRGQWGISADEMGRLVYNHNSAALIGDVTMPNVLLENPYQKVQENVGNYYTDNMRIYPIQATSINRGYEPNSLDSLGRVKSYTSACSPLVFLSNGLGKEYQNDGFVCAPEANLIANYKIDHLSQTATRKSNKPFIVSKDETFRPVSLNIGFDGSLLITDMRKGVIQHTAYLSSYLREKILEKGLDTIVNQGRIYRVFPKDQSPKDPRMGEVAMNDLPLLLNAPNQAVRLFAQKKLVFKNEPSKEILDQLYQMAMEPSIGPGCIHAWYTLEAMELITSDLIKKIKVDEITPAFAVSFLPILKRHEDKNSAKSNHQFKELYQKMISLNHKVVDTNLAINLGKNFKNWESLYRLSDKYPEDPRIAEAIVAGIYPQLVDFKNFEKNKVKNTLLNNQLSAAIQNQEAGNNLGPKFQTELLDDNRTNGLKLFKKYCAACHGFDGLGLKNLAPSLTGSTILKGPKLGVLTTILKGYDSGIGKFNLKMPAYINDPKMTDQDIADIVSYLFSTFAKRWDGVSEEAVRMTRDSLVREVEIN